MSETWLRSMGDAEDAAGGSVSVGGFAVDAGLYTADDALRNDLGAAMERVRACDEKVGEDGLCDCARFVGAVVRERTRHVPVMREIIEQQSAALVVLAAFVAECQPLYAAGRIPAATWLAANDAIRTHTPDGRSTEAE